MQILERRRIDGGRLGDGRRRDQWHGKQQLGSKAHAQTSRKRFGSALAESKGDTKKLCRLSLDYSRSEHRLLAADLVSQIQRDCGGGNKKQRDQRQSEMV